jgi:hypothetical protein
MSHEQGLQGIVYLVGTWSAATVRPMPTFALQFPIEDVRAYASHFPSEGDDAALALGSVARERGYYTRAEFLRACRWKTPRSAPLTRTNSASAVRNETRVALADSSTERERMTALLSLHGVGWPTASVLLHLAYPDRYPILDQRAIHALGARQPSSYGFGFWEAYVAVWVELAARAGVDGRTFDRALWQWSKEQAA